jgi:hypothetical protein
VALPHRRQQLAKFIQFHELTHQKVATALGTNAVRVANLTQGHVYPSPDEIEVLQRLFGMPIETLLEEALLVYRNDWPPPRGAALYLAEARRQVESEK